MMKHLLAFMLAGVMLLSLASCSSSNNANSSENVQTERSAQNATNRKDSALPHEVKEFAYALNGEYLYYAVVIHNPNADYAIDYPSFRITARDGDGILLGTEEQTLSIIYPEQDFCYAFQAFHVDETPTTVDIEIVSPKEENIRELGTLRRPDYTPMAVVNTAMRNGVVGKQIVGEVQNDNNYDYDTVVVTVFFKDADDNLIVASLSHHKETLQHK